MDHQAGMIKGFEQQNVVCRPALAQDTEQVMELCSHIWEGGDYIPIVWNDWLADPEGLLGVAEMGGRIVGVFKLTKFREGEWYMEGLRVHPDFQGKGIASHVHAYVVETWRRMGSGVVRLVTHSENIKVHHMCEQDGFKRIAEFIPYRAEVVDGRVNRFLPVKSDEAQRVLDFVMISPTHALSSRLIDLGWVYGDPQVKYLQEVIGKNHAWWWKDDQGFISIWEDEEEDSCEPGIQLLACTLEHLSELLMDCRQLMGEMGYKSVRWVAPNHQTAIDSLVKAGYERAWDKSLFVYELRASVGQE